jgi:hypothetical protein
METPSAAAAPDPPQDRSEPSTMDVEGGEVPSESAVTSEPTEEDAKARHEMDASTVLERGIFHLRDSECP